MQLNAIEDRLRELEKTIEDNRKWYHDRLEWFIDYYRKEWVEMEQRLAADRSVENLVKAIEV